MVSTLPNELLMAIFEFIPERWNIAATCRQFYQVVCAIEKNLYKVVLTDEKMLQDSVTYCSIIKSSRVFNVMSIQITIKMTSVCWDRLEKIMIKNSIKSLSIVMCDPRAEAHNRMIHILHKLPDNSILDMNITTPNAELISCFVSRQNAITKLSITGGVKDGAFISNLNLTHLKLVGPKTHRLAEIIKAQPKISYLKVTTDSTSIINNEVCSAIFKLENLEALDVPFNQHLTPQIIRNLRNLKKLRNLSVSCMPSCFRQLVSTQVPSIDDLDVTINEPISADVVGNLVRNIPNLRSMKLKGPLVANFFSNFVNCYPKLESLWIENDKSFYVIAVSFRSRNEACLNLKHLFVINRDKKVMIYANDLIRFIRKFPNLRTLVISDSIDIYLNNLEALLRHLPLLREIVINSKHFDSTSRVMRIIKEFGSGLRFVKFENFHFPFDAENLKIFFEGKFLMIEKTDALQFNPERWKKVIFKKNYGLINMPY